MSVDVDDFTKTFLALGRHDSKGCGISEVVFISCRVVDFIKVQSIDKLRVFDL